MKKFFLRMVLCLVLGMGLNRMALADNPIYTFLGIVVDKEDGHPLNGDAIIKTPLRTYIIQIIDGHFLFESEEMGNLAYATIYVPGYNEAYLYIHIGFDFYYKFELEKWSKDKNLAFPVWEQLLFGERGQMYFRRED